MSKRFGAFLIVIILLSISGAANATGTVAFVTDARPSYSTSNTGLTTDFNQLIPQSPTGSVDAVVAIGDMEPIDTGTINTVVAYSASTAASTPLFFAVGNHEVDYSNNEVTSLRTRFSGYSFAPNSGPAGSSTTTYSFNVGDIHVVVLNEYWDGNSDGACLWYTAKLNSDDSCFKYSGGVNGDGGFIPEALFTWLQNDLNANTKNWTVVVGHEPLYPQRTNHVGDSLDKNTTNRDRLQNLFISKNVTAFVGGHTHQAALGTFNNIFHADAGVIGIMAGRGAPNDNYATIIYATVNSTGHFIITKVSENPTWSTPSKTSLFKSLVTAPITPILTTITVAPSSASISVGSTQTFTADPRDQYGAPYSTTLSWTSSDSSVGTVNPTIGTSTIFSAITSGTTTITVSGGGVSNTTTMTVASPPVLTSISISPLSASFAAGATQQFTASPKDQFGNSISATVTWTSSNTTVGTISSSGLFTASNAGASTITATSGSVSSSATATVTSTSPPLTCTYYVSPTGLDTNTGTSTSTPLKTITYALQNKVNAGNTLCVMDGTYAENIVFPKSGTSTAWITVVKYSGTPTITASSGDAITLSGRSYIEVNGLTLNTVSATGYRADAVSNLRILNTDITMNGGSGISFDNGAHDVLVDTCKITGNAWNSIQVMGNSYGVSGASWNGKADSYNIVVNNCEISNNAEHNGFDLRGNTHHVTLSNSYLHDITSNAAIYSHQGLPNHISILNNRIETNIHDGFYMDAGISDSVIDGNYINAPSTSNGAFRVHSGEYGDSANNVYRNNQVCGYVGLSGSNITLTNNNFVSAIGTATGCVLGSWVSTPTFSPASGTYTTAQSVTISTATTGATIHYTLDGTTPTEASVIYSSPIMVSLTTTIKAGAWKSGMTASPIATATYNIGTPVLASITVSPSSASIATSTSQQFSATPKDQFGNPMAATITWSSSNTSVGTISSSGLFTALAAGTSIITASSGSVSVTATVAAATTSSGLIVYLRLDETSGTIAADSSGNGNTGTLINFQFDAKDGWTAGKNNNGLLFDGINDYVSVPDSASIDANTLTVTAWVKSREPSSNYKIAVKKAAWNDANGWSIELDPTGRVTVLGSGSIYVRATVLPSWDNAWHHLAVTISAASVKIYLDGVLKGSGNVDTLVSNTIPLSIGRITAETTSYFNGTIDEVKIYNQALSESEILAEYNTGSVTIPLAPQNLQAITSDTNVSLTWTAPSDGGSAITNYKIYQDGILNTTVGNVLAYTNTGLTNGQSYTYQVSAVNAIGEGAKSNTVSATPSATLTPLLLYINVKSLQDTYFLGDWVGLISG